MFCVLLAFITGRIPYRNYLKAKRVSHAALQLPLGSSKAEVTKFLEREGVVYNYIGKKEEIDHTSDVLERGYNSSNIGSYVVADIPYTSGGLCLWGDVQYLFFFDKRGQLLKTIASERHIGL